MEIKEKNGKYKKSFITERTVDIIFISFMVTVLVIITLLMGVAA